VHGYVGDLFFWHVYLKGFFDGLGQTPGVLVLGRRQEPLQDIVIHLDFSALQETLDHQRDVDAQAHEGAVGD
jgi:hypothetical protein